MGNTVQGTSHAGNVLAGHIDKGAQPRQHWPRYYTTSLRPHHGRKVAARSSNRAKYLNKNMELDDDCHEPDRRLGDTPISRTLSLVLTSSFESTIASMPHCTQQELMLYRTLYDRAIRALHAELEDGEVCVPSEMWHAHFGTVPGAGMAALELIMHRIEHAQTLQPREEAPSHSESRSNDASGKPSATAAAAATATAAAPSPVRRTKHTILPHPHRIVTLNLTNLNLGEAALGQLLPVFLHHTGVRHVLLARNNLTDSAVHGLTMALDAVFDTNSEAHANKQARSDIETLDLTDNPISPAGLKDIALRTACVPRLSRIKLGSSLKPSMCATLHALSASASGNVRQTTPPMKQTHIDVDVAAALGDMVKVNKGLRAMTIKGNCAYKPQSDDDASVAECFPCCDGHFTTAGLIALLRRTTQDCGLRELHLLHCYHAGPNHTSATSLALDSTATRDGPTTGGSRSKRTASERGKSAPACRDARCGEAQSAGPEEGGSVVSCNPGHTSAASTAGEGGPVAPLQLLAEALRSPATQLCVLTLQFPLSDEAVGALAGGLAHATALRKLFLGGCELSAAALRLLAEGVALNRTLVLLDVSSQGDTVTHPTVLRARALAGREGPSHPASWLGADVTRLERPRANCEERPLLPLIRALRANHVVETLSMRNIRLVHDDVEELCACLERFGNCGLMAVEYTGTGSEALAMKLEGLLRINRTSTEAARVRAEEVAARRRQLLTRGATAASPSPPQDYAHA